MGGPNGFGDPRAALVALLTLLAGACGVVIVLGVILMLFNYTLARTVRQVHEVHRRMQPSQVWLDMIPVFNVVWGVLAVLWVSASLKGEFNRRGEHRKGARYGIVTGLTGLILPIVAGLAYWLASALQVWMSVQNFLWMLLLASGGVAVVSFVVYWIRMAVYGYRLKVKLPEPPPPQARRVS